MSFEQGITGIVGPNGSGKSNISDAVRWVLGEQSARTLRGAKMEDVIFNGTETRRKLAYCEVTLVFDNEDHELPLEYAEVAVTRRVYRNGDSEYQINRAACRLKDIIDLFRDTGVGKEGYSLIGQGRIDEILSAKSEERRQVFEEAAGINKYKARKDEAQRRMENTAQNLARVEDIIGELEGRLEPLKAQSESAREYLALRDELKLLDLNAFLIRSERYTQRVQELKQSVEAMAESLNQLNQEQIKMAETRAQMEQTLSSHEQASAQAREQVQSLIQQVEAKEGASAVLRERIAAARRECDRLKKEIAQADSRKEASAKQLTVLNERTAFEKTELEGMRARLEVEEIDLRDAEEKLLCGETELEQVKARVIESMNRLSDVRSEQSRLSAMEQQLLQRITQLQEEAQRDAGLDEQFEEKAEAARKMLETEQRTRARIAQEVQQADEAVQQNARQGEQLNRDIATISAQRQSAFSRLKVLQEMQRDYEGYQNSVKQVLMQARRTPDSGVHGVVATLIQVPKELERAIDMVLGGALQNVVVDAEENAKRMIDYLRAGRLGRATFLPISSVRGRTLNREERQVLNMPGCVGLASELVRYDERYRGIVENLLGRTVVARDLTSGIAIQRAGRHAFRLVTLEGDVMHSGGSMTGGSVQSRMTSLLSREREVGEHKKLLADLENRLNQSRQTAQECETQRAQLKQRRGALYDQLHQQDISCAREEAHLSAAQAELDAHRQRVAERQAECRRMSAQLADVRDEARRMDSRQGDVEQDSAEHQSEIVQRQNDLNAQREALSQLRDKVTSDKIAAAARERGLSALLQEQQRASEENESLLETAQRNRALLQESETQLGQDASQLKSEERALQQLKRELDEQRNAFNRVDEQRTSIQQRIGEMTKRMDVSRSDADALTERHHRAEIQLSKVEAEFKQMQDHIWEDYELTYAGAQPFKQIDFDLNGAEQRMAAIRARIKAMGAVNMAAMDEYRQTQERFNDLTSQRDDLNRAQLDLQKIVEELQTKMEEQFTAQFAHLNSYFKQTFVKLFGGGQAELRLADPKDALNCGIEIVAQPPGKKLQMLSLLSGGERALTAIAILFAMLKLKPTPFCFLDEIEAALDDANIDNFAEYLAEYSKKTQFVVVTHRKGTMERCDALYGIAMEEKGVSKMVSVKLSEQQAG
jgi:chromosome segregation protein